MSITAFDHYTIRCADLDKTWAFYRDVLGLRIETRERPAGAAPNPNAPRAAIAYFPNGEWFIHLFQATPEQEAIFDRMQPQDEDMERWRTGRMHHISVHATGYDETVARLTEHGVAFRSGGGGERRLLQFQDPDGIEVELTFYASEQV